MMSNYMWLLYVFLPTAYVVYKIDGLSKQLRGVCNLLQLEIADHLNPDRAQELLNEFKETRAQERKERREFWGFWIGMAVLLAVSGFYGYTAFTGNN
jgi:hypothetical protein